MHDKPMTTGRVRAIRGNQDDLDAANIWARVTLHALLGAERGEAEYLRTPALPILLAYRYAVATGPVH
jgi:hypothetical protein